MGYLYLSVAIVIEVIATIALKSSSEFTKIIPSIICVIGYATSIYLLTFVFQYLPVGITYAIWSGMGIVFITVISAYIFREIPDFAAIIGILFIISGVIIINLFSSSS